MSLVLCDTNIFISAFNGIEKTIADLSRVGGDNVLMPSITVMELYRGMDNKEQMTKMVRKIKSYNVLDFNEQVSQIAIKLVQEFKLSHNLQIPDAIIAALIVNYEIPIFTYNIKDFKFIPGLKLYEPIT